MTKRMKRNAGLCVAAAFGATLLAGCSHDDTSTPPPTPAAGSGARSQTGPPSTMPAGGAPTGAPAGAAPTGAAPASGGGGVAGAATPN